MVDDFLVTLIYIIYFENGDKPVIVTPRSYISKIFFIGTKHVLLRRKLNDGYIRPTKDALCAVPPLYQCRFSVLRTSWQGRGRISAPSEYFKLVQNLWMTQYFCNTQ